MTKQRIYWRTVLFICMAAIAGMFFSQGRLAADPVPGKQDARIVKSVCEYLKQVHLTRPDIGEEISRRLFKHFIRDLDPTKLYFLKSDVDEFKKYETELSDRLLEGDISFAYKAYERLVKRVGERTKLVEEFVNAPHDFTVKEFMSTDYDHMEPPANDAEVRERWRQRIKFDLLQQRVAKKPVPEAEAKEKILKRYQGLQKRWKQLDNYDLLELYLTDLTTSVDPHSTYMSPSTLADFDISMRLNLDGIGALLRSENGVTMISEIVPGGAAAVDGRLKAKDKIIAVAQGDGKFVDVMDMKITDVVKHIRGKRGTKVELKVIPVGKIEPIVYVLTRQKIELKSQEARAEIIEQGKKADGTPFKIGVIDLPSFYADMKAGSGGKSATEDVRKILKEFKAKNVDGLVLDLRHNGGGSLREALSLTGLFIDQGPVVQVKDYDGKVQRGNDPEKGTVYAGPMIVLVSKFSASASEILAGAMQDYGRALLVGDSATHGKGSVQTVIDMGGRGDGEPAVNLGALKLTIQQFYRVNGDSTQNRGVASDIVLPTITDELAPNEKDLDYALPFDQVKPADHEELNMVPAELKAYLKTRSEKRIKDSKDFAKLQKELEILRARKARKSLPLSEKELRDEMAKDDANHIDDKPEGADGDDQPVVHTKTYKFQRNFTNNEILQIMEDLLQGNKTNRAVTGT
jgi:carboxyl-terminal processing protease